MRNIGYKYVFIFCLLLSTLSVFAQQSAVGKKFTFAYPQNQDGSYIPFVSINVTNPDLNQTGTAIVSIPATNYTTTLNFDGNLLAWGFGFPASAFMTLEEGKDDYVVQIDSDVELVVHAASYYDNHPEAHGDAALILPDEVLGTDYYVVSHNESPGEYVSEAVVVATKNNTFIDIVPTADTRMQSAGEKLTIQLDRGERYQIQSQGDLTGTYIGVNRSLNTECAPIAVFAGSVKTTVGPRTTAGHMYKQMYPLSAWGRTYSILPFGTGRNEYLLKIVALENDTRISANGQELAQTLNAGEFLELTLDEPTKIASENPIQIAQFFTGFATGNDKPDPFMILPLANEHFSSRQNNYIPNFVIFDPTFESEQFQTVIMRTDESGAFSHVTPGFRENLRTFPPDREFSYSSYFLNNVFGNLSTTGNQAYLLNHYVFGNAGSLVNHGFKGNTGFAELDTLGIEIDPLADAIGNVSCVDETLNFKAIFYGKDGVNPAYDTFEWDFGNGITAQGDSVFHTYTEPGDYQVFLRASHSTNLCSEEETTSIRLTVVDRGPDEIVGPASVCPNLEGVTYRVIGAPQERYDWVISGGIIREDNGEEILVDWGDTNDNALLTLVTENEYGCVSDTLRFSVRINEQLEPGLPVGSENICFTDRQGQVYLVPETPGSVYTWRITGGSIVSGQGSNVITVNWDEPGAAPITGTLEFTESSTTQTDVCDGDSPVLTVFVYPDLQFDYQRESVSCFGEADGMIRIEPSGGLAPYTYQWPDGATDQQRNDLSLGTFLVTVTDAIGCTFSMEVSMTEPAELAATLDIQNVSCHAGADGLVTLNISGGTAPYQASWNGGAALSSVESPGLSAGVHSVRITDANDCEQVLNFEVTEPEPLTARTTDTPTCSGQSTGSIFVEASGGTAPYTYRWNTSPPQDGALIRNLPAGIYSVTVTDANGCTFTFPEEEITERVPQLYMPNAFSPNGDGDNDTFGAIFDCGVDYQLRIFSKWGDVIFFTDDINTGWDGTVDGKEAPLGVYTYLVSYSLVLNGAPFSENLRGKVRIFR